MKANVFYLKNYTYALRTLGEKTIGVRCRFPTWLWPVYVYRLIFRKRYRNFLRKSLIAAGKSENTAPHQRAGRYFPVGCLFFFEELFLLQPFGQFLIATVLKDSADNSFQIEVMTRIRHFFMFRCIIPETSGIIVSIVT